MSAREGRPRWLLLIHQLPREPAYLRVKIGRRLASVGAIALKGSVYVLPARDETAEDFAWIRKEILEGGGEATVVEADLVSGVSDAEVIARFRDAKDAEYAALGHAVDGVEVEPRGRRVRPFSEEEKIAARAALRRIEAKIDDIAATDFFDAPGRAAVMQAIAARRAKLDPASACEAPSPPPALRGRTWVTRSGMHVDRIASAWLVRRAIDPEATFKYVPHKGYVPLEGELRFDMQDAEYGHEGDACTFETLVTRFGLDEPGLSAVAEIVHDIDLKDGKFARPETAGVAACIAGLCRLSEDDDDRLARGTVIFDALLRAFARRPAPRTETRTHR